MQVPGQIVGAPTQQIALAPPQAMAEIEASDIVVNTVAVRWPSSVRAVERRGIGAAVARPRGPGPSRAHVARIAASDRRGEASSPVRGRT